MLDWASIEERSVGHQNRREIGRSLSTEKATLVGGLQRQSCPRRMLEQTSQKVRGYTACQKRGAGGSRRKPVLAMRLQVLKEGCRSWSVLAEAVLMVDAAVNFDKFEADKNSTWLGASIPNKATLNRMFLDHLVLQRSGVGLRGGGGRSETVETLLKLLSTRGGCLLLENLA
ncbi:hypothetical protein BSKO_12972 [Bryopsis sp. KO-2023]|nr:hypothetical protein BSKO_12972 [Bryopsis sp. KO-2023]